MQENCIKAGDYVIIQRQGYTKLHKMKQTGTITLGKDLIELNAVLGHQHYQTFRMALKPGSKRLYELEAVTALTTSNQLSVEQSGADNRHIVDDGSSQGLTKAQIEDMREQAMSSSDIMEQLVANSKTFHSKTEYSQAKYLRKKERKYFEYIQVRRPSLRLLAQMFYRQDPAKTLGMRVDDLSQILTYANVQSDGNFLLYDSGTSGLVPAAIMNAIGANTTGYLIHTHPGNECQKNAFIAMQFPKQQAERCIHVNLYSVLRCFYQNKESYTENSENIVLDTQRLTDSPVNNSTACTSNSKNIDDNLEASTHKTVKNLEELNESLEKTNENTRETSEKTNNDIKTTKNQENTTETNTNSAVNPRKRKLSGTNSGEIKAKKPCWQIENEKACHILQDKVDSIIIVAKEHPVNIVKELLPFLKAGRTIVVFSLVKEPLQDLYFYLKSRTDFIAVKLSSNFMRNYQILPERTHPEINMNFGGYILSGYKLNV